ncbi:hypothetical protein PM082_009367 [Marasmius tenuissimus]|nr:hypothetical protein PM082_009367 [Marasmius tenuissimus]
MVYAPHWYDLKALFEKAFGDFSVNVQGLSRGMFPLRAFYWGQKGCRDNYALQIRNIVESGYKALGEKPVVIGECGIPMDLNKAEAFVTEDFTWQSQDDGRHVDRFREVSCRLHVMELQPIQQRHQRRRLERRKLFLVQPGQSTPTRSPRLPPILSYTRQRRKNPHCRRETVPSQDGWDTAQIRVRGHKWSVCVRVEQPAPAPPKPNSKASVSKPPLDGNGGELKAWETEIYIPHMLTQGRRVFVSGLDKEDKYFHDEERQTLFIVVSNRKPGRVHRVEVVIAPRLRPIFFVNDFWSDWGGAVAGFGFATSVLVAVIAYIVYASYIR